MDKALKANTGSFTLGPSVSTTTTAGSVTFTISGPAYAAPARAVTPKQIENAVYAHIQAVRALGRTQIAPEEIARALGLSLSEVQGTIAALRQKGVKSLHAT
jgi:hypothetical protein